MSARSLRLIKVSSWPPVADDSFTPHCFQGCVIGLSWCTLERMERHCFFFFWLIVQCRLVHEARSEWWCQWRDLFLTLIQCMILSNSIICYSVCLESAACGRRTRRALRSKCSVIHHFGSTLHRNFYSSFTIFISFLFCIMKQRSFRLIYVYVCTQQKAINQTCICILHNVSRVWMKKYRWSYE